MAISTIALIVFLILYGLTACGLYAVPSVVIGIVAFIAAIALLVGR